MADPTGTVGAPRVSSDVTDLGLVLKGGSDLAARLQQLADARAEHDAAFERLKLGKNAQSAMQRANAALASADERDRRAAAALVDARDQAQDIVDKANKKAAETAKAAMDARLRAEADADDVRKQVNDCAKKAKKDADALLADAADRMAMATKANAEANAAHTAALAAAAAARDAEARANTLANTLQAKIDRLSAAIRSVM